MVEFLEGRNGVSGNEGNMFFPGQGLVEPFKVKMGSE